MSALNMIVQGQRAHLLTDRAVYDRDGVVRGIGFKVGRLESLPLAISSVGAVSVERLSDMVDRLSPTSAQPEAWVAVLPAALRALRGENRVKWPELEGTQDAEITLAAIFYSHAQRRARGVVVSSGDPGLPPYEPVALSCITIPGIDLAAAGAPDPRSPTFDPASDGAALVSAQRLAAWADGRINVGGGVDLTSVGPDGLSLTTLMEWPDEIGRRIELPPTAAALQ